MRISNSFSEGEIAVMEFILSRLLRGYDPKIVIRRKDFASLYRKVLHMKSRAEKEKGSPLDPIVLATEEGSGVVARADMAEQSDDGTRVDAE
ncbi:hypothetical protein EPO33_01015 [Patescibacteria group bacterium]|nr:MAG: hypothetical protein EPO33_01015 [Patescibacteria group bacterium]